MFQIGMISPVILIGVVLILTFAGGIYLGTNFVGSVNKAPNEVNEEIVENPPIKTPSLAPRDLKNDNDSDNPDQEILKKVTSNEDLPEIAQAVVKYKVSSRKDVITTIQFTSNDGEYATVNTGQVGYGGGELVFLIKRGNWIVIDEGQGPKDCREVIPLRQKYNIQKDFPPCVESSNP